MDSVIVSSGCDTDNKAAETLRLLARAAHVSAPIGTPARDTPPVSTTLNDRAERGVRY
jgi:hypothetical protein